MDFDSEVFCLTLFFTLQKNMHAMANMEKEKQMTAATATAAAYIIETGVNNVSTVSKYKHC